MRTSIALLFALTASSAFAHPGDHHGSLLTTLWHLVSEPDHLALIAIAVAVGATLAIALRRRARNKK
jgi:hydrogenase/urease accessory protein HupE